MLYSTEMPAAKDWSPEKISIWVHEFVQNYGHLPHMIDMDKGGPNSRNRKIYGGVAGILAVAGISVAAHEIRRRHSRDSLKAEVKSWADEHFFEKDKILTQADLHTARSKGQLSFHPDTISNHFDSWRDFLVETGIAQYDWSPSECVQFARLLTSQHGTHKLQKLTDKNGIAGKTPVFETYKDIYPDIKTFMRYRVHWENWQPKTRKPVNLDCWVGYAALALARSSGDSSYIAKEMDVMSKIGIGPAHDLDLIGQINPLKNPKSVDIWLQDKAVQVYEKIMGSGMSDPNLATIHPVFIPEIKDAL
jgi:hypothetical protein